MKKYITAAAVVVALMLLAASFVENKQHYKDSDYAFEFSYPSYMDLESSVSVPLSSDLKYINVRMKTLPGLGPIVEIRVKESREAKFVRNTKASENQVKFGNTQATRLDWSVGGGYFVTFEIRLKDNKYLYIETDKHFFDKKFSDEFQGTSLQELKKGADGFWQISDSFTIN